MVVKLLITSSCLKSFSNLKDFPLIENFGGPSLTRSNLHTNRPIEHKTEVSTPSSSSSSEL